MSACGASNDGGSWGPATVSTLREAEVLADAGVHDILYAEGIAPAKLNRVCELRRAGVDLAVTLDTLEQVSSVCEASRFSLEMGRRDHGG